ncbi:MAG: hypothetical protein HUJ75_03785, partial [Parasporobacterium sp.]|nr:hypothetical protein [Parasporobacterium sp.]
SLENQMQYFYDKTGCQPYLLDLTGEAALTEDQLAQKADDFYKETFKDQAHLLVVFQADETNAFKLHILPGTDAAMVMDKEACDILKANIEKFAADPKMDTDLVMPNAFAQSADDIMQGGRNNTVLIIILVVVVLAAYFLTSRRKTGGDSGQGSSYLGGLFGGRR